MKTITATKLSWERAFAYDFMSLPYICRDSILSSLNLKSPEDDGEKHTELLLKIIQRAKEKQVVEKLLDAVHQAKEF